MLLRFLSCLTLLLTTPITAQVASATSHDGALPSSLQLQADLQTSQRWRIAFVLKAREGGNGYWRRVRQGGAHAARELGVEVQFLAPDSDHYDLPLQVGLMESLLQQDAPDGIILVPIHSAELVPMAERAIQRGIPLLVYDTPLHSALPLTQLSFDNELAGRRIGQWVAHQLNGVGSVLILEGPASSQNAVLRRRGFLQGLRDSTIEVLDSRSAGWRRDTARAVVTTWLHSWPQVDAILAANDQMALGAADAIAAEGRSGILVTGIDANPEALAAIRQQRLHATIDQQPEQQARLAVQLMVQHLEQGESFPSRLHWPFAPLFTLTNLPPAE